MLVYKNHQPCEDPINFLGFERLAFSGLGASDLEFYYGGHPNPHIFEPSNNRKIFFSTEEQTWAADSTDSCLDQVEKILTICPPSVTGRKKRELCFFPFNEEYIPTNFEKHREVIYTGAAYHPAVEEILSVITRFDYRFVSFSNDPRITNRFVTYADKLKLIALSKINVIHNQAGNGSPQWKTRAHEAAACKSFILCKKDQWNIIENFFEPEADFLYYEDELELTYLINKVTANYNEPFVQDIINSAHEKQINNYTTRHFIERYLS